MIFWTHKIRRVWYAVQIHIIRYCIVCNSVSRSCATDTETMWFLRGLTVIAELGVKIVVNVVVNVNEDRSITLEWPRLMNLLLRSDQPVQCCCPCRAGRSINHWDGQGFAFSLIREVTEWQINGTWVLGGLALWPKTEFQKCMMRFDTRLRPVSAVISEFLTWSCQRILVVCFYLLF